MAGVATLGRGGLAGWGGCLRRRGETLRAEAPRRRRPPSPEQQATEATPAADALAPRVDAKCQQQPSSLGRVGHVRRLVSISMAADSEGGRAGCSSGTPTSTPSPPPRGVDGVRGHRPILHTSHNLPLARFPAFSISLTLATQHAAARGMPPSRHRGQFQLRQSRPGRTRRPGSGRNLEE